jgi:hypothetical protein
MECQLTALRNENSMLLQLYFNSGSATPLDQRTEIESMHRLLGQAYDAIPHGHPTRDAVTSEYERIAYFCQATRRGALVQQYARIQMSPPEDPAHQSLFAPLLRRATHHRNNQQQAELQRQMVEQRQCMMANQTPQVQQQILMGQQQGHQQLQMAQQRQQQAQLVQQQREQQQQIQVAPQRQRLLIAQQQELLAHMQREQQAVMQQQEARQRDYRVVERDLVEQLKQQNLSAYKARALPARLTALVILDDDEPSFVAPQPANLEKATPTGCCQTTTMDTPSDEFPVPLTPFTGQC